MIVGLCNHMLVIVVSVAVCSWNVKHFMMLTQSRIGFDAIVKLAKFDDDIIFINFVIF